MDNKYIEKEIKILDVNAKNIQEMLNQIGATYLGENIQEIYTYDVPNINESYMKCVAQLEHIKCDFEEKMLINKIKKIFFDLDNNLSEEDHIMVKKITLFDSLTEFASKISCLNDEIIYMLRNDNLIKIINAYGIDPTKWVRLRKSGDKVTITVKHILGASIKNEIKEYAIDGVREIETNIDSLQIGKKLLEELGYFYRNYQEKKRISYRYNNVNIDIDFWPLIPPYMEIEGSNSDEIYELVSILGYSADDVKIMNTDAVYQIYGINIYDYQELKFIG